MFYADLHVHSKYSRATSSDADLEHLALWAGKKGLAVVATGDFTHPAWLQEIRDKLVPAEPGLFRLCGELQREVDRLAGGVTQPTRFLLEVEISTIYKQGDRTRKVHHLIYAPGCEEAERLIAKLSKIGNLASDGRPILGLNSRDLLESTLESGEGCYLVPAHIWTPWFAVLGSKSGFDSVAECYGDLAPHVFALETGLSSDPPMNWRLSQLDRFRLVSNSDAHSPPKLAREACAFATDLDYYAMHRALETGHGYAGTVEFFPEEGKYHLDGHRKCGVCLAPPQTRQHNGVCPVCGKGLTVGVMNRVEELADRVEGYRPDRTAEFRSLVPLPEVIAEIRGVGEKSRQVEQAYEETLRRLGSELFILQDAPLEDLRSAGSPLLAEAIQRMRAGNVIRQAGYDGEYGVIRLFAEHELARGRCVSLLFDLPCGVGRPAHSPPPAAGTAAVCAEAAGEFARTKATDRTNETEGKDAQDPADGVLGLDPDQRAAAEIVRGPLLIVAGPGTGKTRTLTERIAHLVADHGVRPEQCLAITFSRRAAAELSERLTQLLPDLGQRVPVLTFHALGLTILREHAAALGLPSTFRVAGDDERRQLLAAALGLSDRQTDRTLSAISRSKRCGTPLDATTDLGRAEQRYTQLLRAQGLVDFDDLILLPLELFDRDPALVDHYRQRWPWISIDEYQDLDDGQYRLVGRLAPPDGNLCAIGDPDQSIYGFRGANPHVFLRFTEDFPGARTVQLTRNYRSSQTIVAAALQAIAPSSLLTDRVLQALSANTDRIAIQACPTERSEAEFVVHTIERLIGGATFFSMDSGRVQTHEGESLDFSDFAVLYRTESQAEALVEAFARSGLPFQKKSHRRLIEEPAVRAILKYVATAAADAPAPLSAVELLGYPADTRGSNRTACRSYRSALELLKQAADTVWPDHPEAADYLKLLHPVAERCGHDYARLLSEVALGVDVDLWDPRADRVSLLTFHAAKGLEFAVVFLVGCEDGVLPLRWGDADDLDVAEERRLFFVGLTRARDRLFLSHARRRLWRGKVREMTASPFLQEIQDELLDRLQCRGGKNKKTSADTQLQLF
jgi:DNA helicase-2/ATP-dependent DNA helicase PcrA